jgi:hypothetical protein
MILRFLVVVLVAFPIFGQCSMTDLVVEPENPNYGEEIDVRVRFGCPHGSGPYAPRVRTTGNFVYVEFQPEMGGPTVPSVHGDRIFLGRLLPGTYDLVLRDTNGHVFGERTIVVRERPFLLAPHIGGAETEVAIDVLSVKEVRFDGVKATYTFRNDRLIAIAPPHAPGLVDVTVITDNDETLTYKNAFRYGTPQDGDFERVLFPINLTGAGAHGSDWHSDLVVRNHGPVPVETIPSIYADLDSPILPINVSAIPPGKYARFPETARDGGAFLYYPRDTARYLSYSSHIVDRSRSASDLGSEVPVVHSTDTASTLTIPQVRIGEGFRARLRIYDFDAAESRFATVIVTGEDGATHQFRVTLTAETVTCVTTPCLQPTPGFANVDLGAFESLRNVRVGDIRVEAFPRDARLWAFVSVTNNETQRVTIYTPQTKLPL